MDRYSLPTIWSSHLDIEQSWLLSSATSTPADNAGKPKELAVDFPGTSEHPGNGHWDGEILQVPGCSPE